MKIKVGEIEIRKSDHKEIHTLPNPVIGEGIFKTLASVFLALSCASITLFHQHCLLVFVTLAKQFGYVCVRAVEDVLK